MRECYFPAYTIGPDAFTKFNEVCCVLGKRFLLIGGKTALSVSAEKLLSCISDDFILVDKIIYGKECYDERVFEIYEEYKNKNIDFVVGAGGGKAIDTAKYTAHLLGVPVITVPTIASTCAPASALSVVYTKEHTFEKFIYYKKPAFHCFIDTDIIINAPYHFIRAGIGDTLAKHYEVEFSSRGKQKDYSSGLGITISRMCCEPLFEKAQDALSAAKKKNINDAFEDVVLSIIISTGMVSMLVDPSFNGAMAHALFYGFTVLDGFEEKFLHGDVVGYCTAVQLAVDGKTDEAKRIVDFLRSINIETTLSERGIPCDTDYLDRVLESVLADPDMEVIPYPVTKEMLFNGIKTIENM